MSKELITTQMNVNNKLVRVMRVDNVDYISLTDLAKYQNENDPSGVIRNWMSNKNSFDFYNLWEELHNENFNSVESHRIKIEEVGYNRFTMTPKRWKDKNPTLNGNMRDYASILQLVILINLENLNAEMINQGIVQNISGYIQKSKWTWYAPPIKSDRVTYVVYLLEGSIDY